MGIPLKPSAPRRRFFIKPASDTFNQDAVEMPLDENSLLSSFQYKLFNARVKRLGISIKDMKTIINKYGYNARTKVKASDLTYILDDMDNISEQ